mmetsp:Transcript_11867/g.33533  ORF Transcript_11867/g.33533 Transcript_11867/m.33533 type:complete len:301 (-) Transcript_11867:135-1037(-)
MISNCRHEPVSSMAANVSETCRVLVQAIHDFEGAFKETVERIELVQMMAELDWQAKLSHLSNERARLEQERRGLDQRLATAPVADAGLGGPAPQKDEKAELPSCGIKFGPVAARAPGFIEPEGKWELPSCGSKFGPVAAREPAFIEPEGLTSLPPSPGDPRSDDEPTLHPGVLAEWRQTSSVPPAGPVPKSPITVHELHELHARLCAFGQAPPTPSAAPQTPPEAPAPRDTGHHRHHAKAYGPAPTFHRPTKGPGGGGTRKPCERPRHDLSGSGMKAIAQKLHGTNHVLTGEPAPTEIFM